MEIENLTLQIPPQPTSPGNSPKVAAILGITFISAFVVGTVFYFKNSKSMTEEQPRTVIYGERHKNPYDIDNGSIGIYSVNSDTKIQRELFNIPVPDYYILYDIKFCAATNKIYMRGLHRPKGNSNSFVTEIDLKGNVRDLDFTGAPSPSEGGDFALSKDCQKIVWGTTYYDTYVSYDKRKATEIALADVNGGGKRVLQAIKLSPNDDDDSLDKDPLAWSITDPNIVYLTNPGDKSGGLFRLELNTNSISQMNAIPSKNTIMDISNSDNLIAHRVESVPAKWPSTFVTNLANNSTVPVNTEPKGIDRSKFSPDSSMLAFISTNYGSPFNVLSYFYYPRNLYIFDPLKKTDKLVTKIANFYTRATDLDILIKNSNFIDWLTNDTVIYVKDGKDLSSVNINDGKETKLAPVSGELLFVGVSDK